MKASFPILEFDSDPHARIEPHQVVRKIEIPEHCIISFFNNEIHKLHQQGRARLVKKLKSELGSHLVFVMDVENRPVALFHPGIGAPLATALLEEVIALGCKKFVACGGAGMLCEGIEVGSLLIPTAAVRDEGTSYHYLPPAREVRANASAVAAIEQTLQAGGLDYMRVKTWTTDAIYRETQEKIDLRRAEGCQTVEMEAAALFAAAQFRDVQLGYILFAGDDLSGQTWQSRHWMSRTAERAGLIELAGKVVLNL